MTPTAFITGITGQDGSYLAELLLEKGYIVHGLVHRPDALNSSNIAHLVQDARIHNKTLFLHAGAFEDATHLRRIIHRAQPTELYHLAGQSSPRLSLELPEATVDSVGMATLRLLEIIRDFSDPPKFLYACSSEIFGSPPHSPQDELTPVSPTTPYGAAKALSQQMTRIYRTAYQLRTCSAILYNHESPRRNSGFVSIKVARAAARIKKGPAKRSPAREPERPARLGLGSRLCKGMWQMLQADPVDDFILATGQLHTVQQLVEAAFSHVGLNWHDWVKFDSTLITAVEPVAPRGNPAKALRLLGWKNTVPFPEIIARLVDAEMAKLT